MDPRIDAIQKRDYTLAEDALTAGASLRIRSTTKRENVLALTGDVHLVECCWMQDQIRQLESVSDTSTQ